MKRLKSTRDIFRAKVGTTANLLYKTDRQVKEDARLLKTLRGTLLRTKREVTLRKFFIKLSQTADNMGYPPPRSHERDLMLERINRYGRQNSFIGYVAIEHACIHLCIIYEDLIRRVILKYYEENILRLKSKKESLKNHQLIDLLIEGQNIHRTLAERVVDDLMYGSLEDWYKVLIEIGMDIEMSPTVQELFLIRNCIVHNDKKASPVLCKAFPGKYKVRKNIRLQTSDFEKFKDGMERSATFIFSEYHRLFPSNTGTWLGVKQAP